MEIPAIKSWYDSHHGIMAVDDDVLGVVQQVKQLSDGRIAVFYNEQTDGFDLVESCLDGTDRLVFSCDALDQRVLDRLHKADHWGAETPGSVLLRPEGEDYLDEVDADEERIKAEQDEVGYEKIRDAGERLGWALGEDGKGTQASILVKKDVRGPHGNDTGAVRR